MVDNLFIAEKILSTLTPAADDQRAPENNFLKREYLPVFLALALRHIDFLQQADRYSYSIGVPVCSIMS